MCLQALLVTRDIIAQFRPFSSVEHWTWRAQAHADHEPCSGQTFREEVGEWFLAGAEGIRKNIAKVLSSAHLPMFRLNADLWTSKITKHKYLGVRVFWMAAGIMQTALLACTLYSPPIHDPDWEKKQASDWLLEYIIAVLAWYNIDSQDVAGSDGGPDCKRALDKRARAAFEWYWEWCWPHSISTALTAAFGTQKDPKTCTNK